jgi:hypothetical protein
MNWIKKLFKRKKINSNIIKGDIFYVYEEFKSLTKWDGVEIISVSISKGYGRHGDTEQFVLVVVYKI